MAKTQTDWLTWALSLTEKVIYTAKGRPCGHTGDYQIAARILAEKCSELEKALEKPTVVTEEKYEYR